MSASPGSQDLRRRPAVEVSVDPVTFPPQVLLVRGNVTITESHGIVDDYAHAAALA